MAITRLKLHNFTVFEDLSLDFCEGANIFIGENGTGKTHLLKVLYFFTQDLEEDFGFDNFKKIFMVNPQAVIRNRNNYGEAKFTCIIDGDKEKLTTYTIPVSGKMMSTSGGKVKLYSNKPNSIFIPTKEMLSHSKGFLAMNEKFKIPFDKTLIDIMVNAELPETRVESEIGKNILKVLSSIIDGEVIYENDIFYIQKNNGVKIEFSLEAEGLRKFGLLWKLIRNGLIEKDTIIFWDEPEANLNPQLISVLVDVLFELQRGGVQLFIATHDYNLAKYFEVKRRKCDNVLYHSLYKTDNGVKSSAVSNYRDILNNPIEEANIALYNEILEKVAEDIENE